MFHRFLTERESHARVVLTDPLDDLADLELQVTSLEESLPTELSDVGEDESAVELLESRNIARRLDLMHKRLMQSRPLTARVPRLKLAEAATDVGEADVVAEDNEKRAEEVAAVVAEKQQHLERIEEELAELEAEVDGRLRSLDVSHEAKVELVRRLIGRRHEVDEMMSAINKLREANARLGCDLARTFDEGATVRRKAIVGRCWEEAYDADKEETRRRLLVIQEKKHAAARRDQKNRKRAEALAEQAVEVAQREQEAEEALSTILEIEANVREIEKKLNVALREAKDLAGVDQGDQRERWLVEEMYKVFRISVDAEAPQ
jgi:hypothetical protein